MAEEFQKLLKDKQKEYEDTKHQYVKVSYSKNIKRAKE
jgi:hypothetical protein